MRDVNAIPPGDVGASVHVWLDAARKVLELARSRSLNLIASVGWRSVPDHAPEVQPEPGENTDAWALPDTLPPLDLTALDRALALDRTRDETTAM